MSIVEGILKEYFSSRPDPQALLKSVNDQMNAYEDREERRKKELAERSKTVDEDGFMTVVNSHPIPQAAAKEQEEPFEGLKNFYKFQTRQQKVNQMEELRRKFEEDKLRLAQLWKNKMFDKP